MMKEPSLFWVDPGELSRLLSDAGVVPSRGAPGAPPAIAAGPAPSRNGSAADPPPFEIPVGSFEDRLLALLDWLRAVAAFEHAFVVDQEGLALVRQESAPPELIAASAEISERWDSLRNRFGLSESSYVAIDLGRRERLHLLAAASPWGLLCLGFVAGHPLDRKKIAAIQHQFRRTLKKEGAD